MHSRQPGLAHSTMTINLDLQIADDLVNFQDFLPSRQQAACWIRASIQAVPEYKNQQAGDLCIRIVTQEEARELNQRYRGKTYASNVLSFPANLSEQPEAHILGDLLLCAKVINQEAMEQHKNPEAHWAHMMVHGTLHLLGYDHINAAEARVMERLEISILQSLDFPNPYLAS